LGLTGARLAPAPGRAGPKKFYRKLTRFSAAFACLADTAMGTLGGSLKRKEMVTGRLADILSNLYLASAALKLYVDAGRPKHLNHVLAWSVQQCLYECE